jgi:hypothetical protein
MSFSIKVHYSKRRDWCCEGEQVCAHKDAQSPSGFLALEMDQQDKVPYYVLVSPSSQTQSPAATGSTTPVLNHPVLQYHYANDSPLSLLPRSPNEQVLVVDYDPLTPQCTRAQSISGSSAVTGIKVTEAPGAGPAEGSAGWCNSIFVLETTTFESRFVGHGQLGYDTRSENLSFKGSLQTKAILGQW